MEERPIAKDIDKSRVKTYTRTHSCPTSISHPWAPAMIPNSSQCAGPVNWMNLPTRSSQPKRQPIRRHSDSETSTKEPAPPTRAVIATKSDKCKQGLFDKLSSSAQKFGKEHLTPEQRAWARQVYHKTPMHAFKIRRGKSLCEDGLTREERIALIYGPMERIEVTREFSLSIETSQDPSTMPAVPEEASTDAVEKSDKLPACKRAGTSGEERPKIFRRILGRKSGEKKRSG
jgi:hypothetical protein